MGPEKSSGVGTTPLAAQSCYKYLNGFGIQPTPRLTTAHIWVYNCSQWLQLHIILRSGKTSLL